MRWITKQAKVVCAHQLGVVHLTNSQSFVQVTGSPVLVEGDPQGRLILGCPNVGPTIKPCMCTLVVTQGYSDFIRIEGLRVCLDTVSGLTDGTPPGSVKYGVNQPGQSLVSEEQPK